MKGPYIGITDFMDSSEAAHMLQVFLQNGGNELGRRLMIGVMMSYKTLHGLPTKWTQAFPPKENVKNIFTNHTLALNTLHYADYEGVNIEESLELAVSFCGPYLDAIQLDMIWPDPNIVKRFRERHPNIRVVIQVNTKALEAVNDSPEFLTSRLWEYGNAIDYILLDKSMGKGLGMNSSALLRFAREIADILPCLGISVAGGLGPESIHLVEPIAREFPDISIDAQGKLRPSGNALDPIDWNMATAYLIRALKLFERYQKTA